jgi:hypothetical protein
LGNLDTPTTTPITGTVIASAPVQVVPATNTHFNLKSLYAGVRATGNFILAFDLYIASNSSLEAVIKTKWAWAGPVLAGLAAIGELVQAQAAKGKTTSVNNATTVDQQPADALIEAGINQLEGGK